MSRFIYVIFLASLLASFASSQTPREESSRVNGDLIIWIEAVEIRDGELYVRYVLKHAREGDTLTVSNALQSLTCIYERGDKSVIGGHFTNASLLSQGFLNGTSRTYSDTRGFELPKDAEFVSLRVGEDLDLRSAKFHFRKYATMMKSKW